MYKTGFDINNLQWLIGHKTKPNLDHLKITGELIVQTIKVTTSIKVEFLCIKHGVMVFIVGNRYSDSGSKPRQGCLYFT